MKESAEDKVINKAEADQACQRQHDFRHECSRGRAIRVVRQYDTSGEKDIGDQGSVQATLDKPSAVARAVSE